MLRLLYIITQKFVVTFLVIKLEMRKSRMVLSSMRTVVECQFSMLMYNKKYLINLDFT